MLKHKIPVAPEPNIIPYKKTTFKQAWRISKIGEELTHLGSSLLKLAIFVFLFAASFYALATIWNLVKWAYNFIPINH